MRFLILSLALIIATGPELRGAEQTPIKNVTPTSDDVRGSGGGGGGGSRSGGFGGATSTPRSSGGGMSVGFGGGSRSESRPAPSRVERQPTRAENSPAARQPYEPRPQAQPDTRSRETDSRSNDKSNRYQPKQSPIDTRQPSRASQDNRNQQPTRVEQPNTTRVNQPTRPTNEQPNGQSSRVDSRSGQTRVNDSRSNQQSGPQQSGAQQSRTPSAQDRQVKGSPKVNKDNSVTTHYTDGSSVRKASDGKVISQYDAGSHKTVYSNKDGSTTVAQGARSVRSYQNGDKVVHNAANHETTRFDASKNITTIRAPGRQETIDHNTGVTEVRRGRETYQQIPRGDGHGYTRNVTINNIHETRIYNYNYNRYNQYVSYYSPNIYVTPYYNEYVGGFYGGFGYRGAGYYVTPWDYGWHRWDSYPAQICWWGGCNYVGYGFTPLSPYSWRADYGYYYTPVVQIVNPVDYILGTLVAEALEDRRQARLDAEQMAQQDALAQQQALADAAAQDEDQAEVLKAQADAELADAQAERARNAPVIQDKQEPMSAEAVDAQKTTINHVTSEIAKKSGQIDVVDFLNSDKGVHGFQIHDTLTVGVDGSDNNCTLDTGDTVSLASNFTVTKDTENVLVKVLSSVPGDCRPGKVVNVGIEKLQDMLNDTVANVSDAMDDMAKKKMGQQK